MRRPGRSRTLARCHEALVRAVCHRVLGPGPDADDCAAPRPVAVEPAPADPPAVAAFGLRPPDRWFLFGGSCALPAGKPIADLPLAVIGRRDASAAGGGTPREVVRW